MLFTLNDNIGTKSTNKISNGFIENKSIID